MLSTEGPDGSLFNKGKDAARGENTLTHDGKTATRPLFTQRGTGCKFFYTSDGNKNVSELVHFETHGVNVDKSISVRPPIY